MNGPFPCGRFPDIKIFKHNLVKELSPGEKVEADRGYRNLPDFVRLPEDYVTNSDKRAKNRARARHETMNQRLKQFGCLKQSYRHCLKKHKYVFAAAAVCTQLAFENGEAPFQCNY